MRREDHFGDGVVDVGAVEEVGLDVVGRHLVLEVSFRGKLFGY